MLRALALIKMRLAFQGAKAACTLNEHRARRLLARVTTLELQALKDAAQLVAMRRERDIAKTALTDVVLTSPSPGVRARARRALIDMTAVQVDA